MFKDKLKSLIKTEDGKSKKNIENLIVFIILLVVTLIIINTIWNDNEIDNANTVQDKSVVLANTNNDSVSTEDTTQKNLKQILSKIEGVGKVEVLITYSESSQIVAMYNEKYKESQTEEGDTSGGKRVIQEVSKDKEIIYQEDNGEKVPITEKVVMPKMEGALIVAEGANDAFVKTNIIQAVEALTGLATHKIQVLEMKSNT